MIIAYALKEFVFLILFDVETWDFASREMRGILV